MLLKRSEVFEGKFNKKKLLTALGTFSVRGVRKRLALGQAKMAMREFGEVVVAQATFRVIDAGVQVYFSDSVDEKALRAAVMKAKVSDA